MSGIFAINLCIYFLRQRRREAKRAETAAKEIPSYYRFALYIHKIYSAR